MDAAGSIASRVAGQPSIDSGMQTTAWNFAAWFAFKRLGFGTADRSPHDAHHPQATGYRPLL